MKSSKSMHSLNEPDTSRIKDWFIWLHYSEQIIALALGYTWDLLWCLTLYHQFPVNMREVQQRWKLVHLILTTWSLLRILFFYILSIYNQNCCLWTAGYGYYCLYAWTFEYVYVIERITHLLKLRRTLS